MRALVGFGYCTLQQPLPLARPATETLGSFQDGKIGLLECSLVVFACGDMIRANSPQITTIIA